MFWSPLAWDPDVDRPWRKSEQKGERLSHSQGSGSIRWRQETSFEKGECQQVMSVRGDHCHQIGPGSNIPGYVFGLAPLSAKTLGERLPFEKSNREGQTLRIFQIPQSCCRGVNQEKTRPNEMSRRPE